MSHSGELKEAMCTKRTELWELAGHQDVRACLVCPCFPEVFSTLNCVKWNACRTVLGSRNEIFLSTVYITGGLSSFSFRSHLLVNCFVPRSCVPKQTCHALRVLLCSTQIPS